MKKFYEITIATNGIPDRSCIIKAESKEEAERRGEAEARWWQKGELWKIAKGCERRRFTLDSVKERKDLK